MLRGKLIRGDRPRGYINYSLAVVVFWGGGQVRVTPNPYINYCYAVFYITPWIDSRIVPSSFPNPIAELACVTLLWRILQEA